MRFRCPDCGGRGKAIHYPHGGGTTICFNCGKRLYAMPTETGIVIRAGKNPHRLILQHFNGVGNTSRPLETVKTVRQMSNQQEVMINGY